MLKTSSIKSTEPRKDVVEVSGDSRAGREKGKPDGSKMDDVGVDGDEVGDDKDGKKGQNPSKSKNLSKSKKTKSGFLISGARRTFTKLR